MLRAQVALARPLNCTITALSVLVGALASGRGSWTWALVLAAASASLLAGAGNVYNDLRDLDIDRINRPGRPLPAGRLSPGAARLQAVLMAATGLAAAGFLGAVPFTIAAGVAVGLVVYSVLLKRVPLVGNLLVAAMAAAAFPFGAVAMGAWGRSGLPALFAFLFHFGRELIKDSEDREGDRARGARTLALILGPRATRLAGAAVFALLAAGTAVPALLGVYGMPYIVPVALMNLVIAAAFTVATLRPPPRGSQFLSRWLTGAMGLGLLAVTLGEVW